MRNGDVVVSITMIGDLGDTKMVFCSRFCRDELLA